MNNICMHTLNVCGENSLMGHDENLQLMILYKYCMGIHFKNYVIEMFEENAYFAY